MIMKSPMVKIICIFGIILIIAIACLFIYKNNKKNKNDEFLEYVPEEEISEEQLRQTIVTLYYKNKETGELMPEARKVDVSILAKNPCEVLTNMLIEMPKSDKLETVIPDGTKLNKIEVKGDVACVDVSKEFIENHKGGKEEETKTIYSIVNTLTELTEINSIRILIDGEENKSFKDDCINFKDNFTRIN